jgi:HEAT repeats
LTPVASLPLADLEPGAPGRQLPPVTSLAESARRTTVEEQDERAASDPDNAIGYRGVMGVLMRGKDEVAKLQTPLRKSLADSSPHVRIAAAEALGLHGTEQDLQTVVPLLLELANAPKSGSYAAIHALNAIDTLGPKARPWKPQILALPETIRRTHLTACQGFTKWSAFLEGSERLFLQPRLPVDHHRDGRGGVFHGHNRQSWPCLP